MARLTVPEAVLPTYSGDGGPGANVQVSLKGTSLLHRQTLLPAANTLYEMP